MTPLRRGADRDLDGPTGGDLPFAAACRRQGWPGPGAAADMQWDPAVLFPKTACWAPLTRDTISVADKTWRKPGFSPPPADLPIHRARPPPLLGVWHSTDSWAEPAKGLTGGAGT